MYSVIRMKSDLEKLEGMRGIIKLHYIPFATVRFFCVFLTLGYIYFLQLSFCDLNNVLSGQRRNRISGELFIQPRIFSQIFLQA